MWRQQILGKPTAANRQNTTKSLQKCRFLNMDLISHLSDQTGAKYRSMFKNEVFDGEMWVRG